MQTEQYYTNQDTLITTAYESETTKANELNESVCCEKRLSLSYSFIESFGSVI